MSGDRFTIHAAVYLVLMKDDKVLLLRRYNTGWSDGMYSLVAGHIEGEETLTEAMCREAKEEAGIIVQPQDLRFAHVMHRNSDVEYLDFYFTASSWDGEPKNMEPKKCDQVEWFPVSDLPENTLPYIKQVIHDIQAGKSFSEVDWPN